MPILQRTTQLTDPFKREFSPTGLDTATCLRKYYYNKILGLTPKGIKLAAHFGSSLHLAIACFYAAKKTKNAVPEVEAIKGFEFEWSTEQLSSMDAKYNLEQGIRIVAEYCKNYAHDTISFHESLIETATHTPMPNGTTMICVIDRVIIEKDLIMVVDTKTTSMSLTDYWFNNFRNSFQLGAEYYAVQQVTGQVDTCQIDGVHVPYETQGPRAKQPPTNFARRTFLRTELQLTDWVNTWCRKTDTICKGLELKGDAERLKYFNCEPSQCNNFGGCPYLPVCMYGLEHPMIRESFNFEKDDLEI